MPTSGYITSFSQALPIYADKSFISNSFSHSSYKSLTEDIVGAGKIYISAINGLGSDDVRLSKRKSLSTRRLRGFQKNNIGIPLSSSNEDYSQGGLYFLSSKREKTSIEKKLEMGDVVLFYPSLFHGMDTIDPLQKSDWDSINGRWFIGCFTVQPHSIKNRETASGI